MPCPQSISGLVVEYIVAIDVTWVRFPADAFFHELLLSIEKFMRTKPQNAFQIVLPMVWLERLQEHSSEHA